MPSNEFLTPFELSEKLKVSLRTIYNYIEKYKNSIRINRVGNKSFFNYDDILNAMQKDFANLQNPMQSKENLNNDRVVVNSNLQDFATLQNALQNLKQEKEDLTKFNNNLQETANKYALALKDEKNEKEKRINEYTKINDKYNNALTDFSKQKVNYTRKLYILVALLCIALTCIGFLIFGLK